MQLVAAHPYGEARTFHKSIQSYDLWLHMKRSTAGSRFQARWLGSFRARLLAGLSSIALLTLFATGFALYLFNQFGEVVDTTAGQAIPGLMAVMWLSESSALLAAAAPVLAASEGEVDLRETETRLSTLVKEINVNIDRLSIRMQGEDFEAVKRHSATIMTTLAALKDATLQRLHLQNQRLSGLTELRKVQGEFVDTLNPVVYGATSLANLLARRGGRRNAAAIKRLVEVDANLLFALLETQAAVYRIAGLLGSAGQPSEGQNLVRWEMQCQAAVEQLLSSLPPLEAVGDDPELGKVAALGKELTSAGQCHLVPLSKGSVEGSPLSARIRPLTGRIGPLVSERRNRLMAHYTQTLRQIKSSPAQLATGAIRDLRYALDIKAEGNLLIGLLTAATDADDKYTIVNLFNRFRSSLEAFRNAVRVFENSELAKRNPVLATNVLELEARLAAFGSGSDTLFTTRTAELRLADHIRSLLKTHREQATQLTTHANSLVAAVQENVAELRSTMAKSQSAAISILVLVCVGSLLISAFIAYFTTRVLGRHESDLRAAKNATEMINKELEAFNYSVSHDLRAPLRTLSGFSQALLEDYGDKLDSEAKTYLACLQDGSHEMGELIDGLLKLSRSARGEIAWEDVNLSEMAHAIAYALRRSDPQRDVTIHVAPALTARADRRLIRAVLENILGNAWKYTEKKRHANIEFGAREGNEGTLYFVRDNGAGFEMTYASKLFQPFQRLHRVEEFEGLGIGLATVQRIIHRHGGKIWAQAEVGKGATFFFTLATSDQLA